MHACMSFLYKIKHKINVFKIKYFLRNNKCQQHSFHTLKSLHWFTLWVFGLKSKKNIGTDDRYENACTERV